MNKSLDYSVTHCDCENGYSVEILTNTLRTLTHNSVFNSASKKDQMKID